jgi:hypothetical protein
MTQAQRRDPFANLKQETAPGWGETQASARSMLDQIPVVTHKRRDRKWEQQNRSHSYRGVPPDVHEQVVDLARSLQVNVDEVAQVFVSYGLSCIECGLLPIVAHPNAQRMTLFPTSDGRKQKTGWNKRNGWETEARKPAAKKVSRKSEKSLWENIVSYRLSMDVHQSVKELAKENCVPSGEIITLFLKHGLESFRSGTLQLNPQPKAVKMTLAETST